MSEAPTTKTEEPQKTFMSDGVPFFNLGGVVTKTATAKEVSYGYIEQNIKRNIPRLHQIDGFMNIKGPTVPIGLIGGGPSLKTPETVQELKAFAVNNPVVACGSSYDWCIDNGIVPTYATAVDPDPVTANYFTKAHQDTVFLLASQCNPDLFDRLKDHKVGMWHCASQSDAEFLEKLEPSFFGIGGGCTVGLRSMNIFIMLGYTNQHFWGFDSCLADDDSDHAYDLSTEGERQGLLGESGAIHIVKVGNGSPTSKSYRCMGYQLAQVQHFKEFYGAYSNLLLPTFHGEGLLPALVKIIQDAAKKELRKEI